MNSQARLFWPTFTTAIMLATLIGLGVWQLQRRTEKAILLNEITERQSMPAADLAANLNPVSQWTWRSVNVVCTLTGPPAWLIGSNAAGDSGYRHLRLCHRAIGANIVVDIGWSKDQRVLTDLPATLTIAGTALVSDTPGWAARLVQPKPQAHLFFARDMRQITADLDPAAAPLMVVSRAPIASLEASATPKRADIPNNHFMYALQWFAFATVLVVVYGVFMVRQRREQT